MKKPTYDELIAALSESGHSNMRIKYGQLKVERDALAVQVAELKRDIKQKKLIHIGFTNEHQVTYVTEQESEGIFYPDRDNGCFIPVYMLDVHAHRVGCESVIYCENMRMKQELRNLPVTDAEVARKAFVAGVEWLKDLPAYSVAGLDAAVREHISQYSTTGTWLKDSNTHCNPVVTTLVSHLERQIAFSLKAFGPSKRTGGIIDHIKKELVEVANAPDDLTEWIDLAMLALDGAWRHVDRTHLTLTQVAEQVQKTLIEKLAKNEARSWPDWRTLSEDKAIEHNRSADELSAKAES